MKKGLAGQGTTYQKISFSQAGEDLIVRFIFDTLRTPSPTYLDIGAHHPEYINNTAIFYRSGSRGVNIEPDPELWKLFPKKRPKDVNLNIGIGDKKEVVSFYIMSSPTLNTFSKQEAKKYVSQGYSIAKVIKVETKEINQVIEESCDGIPDFINIDAEGIDFEILQNLDFNRFAPKVICVETISFSKTGRGKKDYKLIRLVESKGYLLYADTYINSIFVKESLWREQH